MKDLTGMESNDQFKEITNFIDSEDFNEFIDSTREYYLDIIFFNEHKLLVETDIYTKSKILYELVNYRNKLINIEYSKLFFQHKFN